MSEPTKPPAAATPRWASAVVIPSTWTPEQALAVFELLDDLRDRLWTLHGSQIQDLLQQEQGSAASIVQSDDPGGDNSSF
ncbi:MAG: hypothetical protein M3Y26_08270 [Actinomycetota bacterium]|jgi:hypothetical protein|nr:hypothetical protein [Actinomycetota bacterium]